MDTKFDFFERVIVKSNSQTPQAFWGQEGTIIGVSDFDASSPHQHPEYAIACAQHILSLNAQDLEKTGQFADAQSQKALGRLKVTPNSSGHSEVLEQLSHMD